MYKVDPDALHLAQEFKAKPIGKHSAELQKVLDRKSTRLNSSHIQKSRMPSSA